MIHFNELKSNARSLFESFKKALSYDEAMTLAISSACIPYTAEQIILSGKAFSTMEEVKDYIRHELAEEVNVIVEEGTNYTLTDSNGHIDWYRPKMAGDKIDFRFWKRYKKYLIHIKGWAESSVNTIDAITDEIMSDIEDPKVQNRPFDRRGLVVGYVQSGKTAYFLGNINKAIDSGYRIIIVLAGMHENLRQQTQERIDEEVIGRDTDKKAKFKPFGVTTLPGETYIPIDYFTESSNDSRPNKNGDFNIKASHGTPPTLDRPIIFVIKKNKSVLTNLIKYFSDWIDSFDDERTYKKDGVKQFNNLPLLIIDDEADQASVNTKAPKDREGEELDPTAINNCIRQIMNLFRQKVYIGYTATPFANIFIHHDKQHSKLGRDLFPSAFIKTLGAPSNYLGPKEVFGLKDGSEDGLSIKREVNDAGQHLPSEGFAEFPFMHIRHKPNYTPEELPNSLREALKAFVISSAVRWHRGHENKHNTMLIHCTRYNTVQSALAKLVEDELKELSDSILDPDVLKELHDLYERDFTPTTIEMNRIAADWKDIIPLLSKAVKKIEPQCLVINGTVKDILDYKSKEKTGLSVIAIGGDKLSRGLTLEGLTISYFTRSTTLYDTLMQMGRWFGYRSGFEDLCRIYTTPELLRWYRLITTAFEALRSEFIEMARIPLTPKDFGLRVENHPDLMVTNVMKMRATEIMRLNYQGTFTETTTIASGEDILKSNYKAAAEFILSLGEISNKDLVQNNVWLDIPVNQIQEFLKNYKTYKGLPAANSIRINQYIDLQIKSKIEVFSNWNVVLVSLDVKPESEAFLFAGKRIVLPERTITQTRESSYFVQRMHAPSFEFSDFNKSEKKFIDDNHFTNKEARNQSPRKNRPLLMIYVLSLKEKKSEAKVDFEYQPVGFAISWPDSSLAKSISYVINSVYQELEMTEYD